jgi:trehalose 6-phosphate synthase
MAEAIHEALKMSEPEQEARMRMMRAQVKQRNVYRWAGQMLLAAARLRRSQRVQDLIDERQAAG